MRQIAIALRDYEEQRGRLPPPAIYDKNGTALLSWRVLILPYLEAELPFHFDEPWDSPHNLELLPQMPPVYRAAYYPKNESLPEKSSTFCQVFTGPGTAFEGTEGMRLADFGAPLDSVILVAEGGKPVPWTKPEDIEYDDDEPLPALGGVFMGGGRFSLFGENRRKGFCAGLAEEHVVFVEPTMDQGALRRAIKRDEGNLTKEWK